MARTSKEASRKIGAGKDHRVDIKLGDAGPVGSLDFFGDRFTFHINFKEGKVSGSSIVAGGHFAAKLKLSPRNLWELEYTHTGKENTMSVFARFGKITKKTNLFGVSHKDRDHDIKLAFSEDEGINGHVATMTKHLRFALHFSKRGTTAVEIKHSGRDHDLKVKYFPNGEYEFKAKVKVGDGKLLISKSRKGIKAQAEFSF